jgi:hypothetical protein
MSKRQRIADPLYEVVLQKTSSGFGLTVFEQGGVIKVFGFKLLSAADLLGVNVKDTILSVDGADVSTMKFSEFCTRLQAVPLNAFITLQLLRVGHSVHPPPLWYDKAAHSGARKSMVERIKAFMAPRVEAERLPNIALNMEHKLFQGADSFAKYQHEDTLKLRLNLILSEARAQGVVKADRAALAAERAAFEAEREAFAAQREAFAAQRAALNKERTAFNAESAAFNKARAFFDAQACSI